MEEIEVGKIIDGIVTSIKKYGVFLSFEDGYVGLLHISEISGKYISNIFNCFQIGDTIKVVVKTVDKDTKYLSVSMKDLPRNLKPYTQDEDSKKASSYIKNIDFTKLDRGLPEMIERELEKEKEQK